ncbi:MAG: RNA polymerase sigma factor [Thermomonas haemolytica]
MGGDFQMEQDTTTCALQPPHDRHLLERTAAGDQDALRQILDLHGQAVFAFALRRLGSPEDARDVLNDTLLALWQQAHRSLAKTSSLRAWLLGIARHKIADILRARGQAWREIADEDGTLLATATDPDPSPLERLCQACDAFRLEEALQTLPEVQREALYLFTYEGLSLADIATIQQVPQATVGTRLHLARQRLRQRLADGAKNPR